MTYTLRGMAYKVKSYAGGIIMHKQEDQNGLGLLT